MLQPPCNFDPAGFERDLIGARTSEGQACAKARKHVASGFDMGPPSHRQIAPNPGQAPIGTWPWLERPRLSVAWFYSPRWPFCSLTLLEMCLRQGRRGEHCRNEFLDIGDAQPSH